MRASYSVTFLEASKFKRINFSILSLEGVINTIPIPDPACPANPSVRSLQPFYVIHSARLSNSLVGRSSVISSARYDDEIEVHGRTSAMIKNIPTKLSRTKQIEVLDIHCGNENKKVDEQYLGLESCQEEMYKFDFVYLPINFRTGLNMGYAFVNFTRSVGAVRFFRCFLNFCWKSFALRKRAWLLKLLALELQTGDMTSPTHREMCQIMLSQIFVCDMGESELDLRTSNPLFLRNDADYAKVKSITKTKVENILGNPSTSEKGGVYYYPERGDCLIDLASFRDRLWQNLRIGGSSYTLPSTPGKNNSPRLATVASGAALVKLLENEVGGAQIFVQTAYGVKVEVENNPNDPSLMVFIYYRDYMKQKV
ncbi:hypothetical protein GIB67_024432 [Kingdonia uniflora]|uniref:Mei2-like C-terminal RNA recognition motif domain-containing protein n=1 Tax=Kingdonia uniflora TaxID=39325 RepID=A0A7J7P4Z5_9MAGN|nr:hypothetical protein GIB67_024432 [Kingdonia uniflora]